MCQEAGRKLLSPLGERRWGGRALFALSWALPLVSGYIHAPAEFTPLWANIEYEIASRRTRYINDQLFSE
jgi:hypothetical protein